MDEHCLFIDDLHRGNWWFFHIWLAYRRLSGSMLHRVWPQIFSDIPRPETPLDDDDDQTQGSDRNAGAFTPIRTTWQVWQVWLPISSDPSAIISHPKKPSRSINTESETMKHFAWHFSSRGDPFQRDAHGSPETWNVELPCSWLETLHHAQFCTIAC